MQTTNRLVCVVKSVLVSASSHFAISMVMLREGCWVDGCAIVHQDTELSHTYHISLFLLPSVLFFLFHKRSQLFRSSSCFLPFLHPSCSLQSSPLSPLLGELHVLPSSESLLLLNSASPLFSCCVCFYLALLVSSRGPMPFTWEPSSPSFAAQCLAVPT